MSFWHRLMHWLGLNRSEVDGYVVIGGHEWMTLRCVDCGFKEPFFHSRGCGCSGPGELGGGGL